MRIARVLSRLNYGGPARQVLASDPLLVRRGHEVRVLVGDPEPGEGDLADIAERRGLDVVRVPGLGRGLSVAGDLRAARFLRRALVAFAPHVVHTHASKAGVLGRRAARAVAGVKTVHTFHGHVLEGYFPAPVSKGIAALERRLARTTDRVIAVSHATAEDLVRLEVVPEERLVVVPPGIDLEPFLELEVEPAARRDGALRKLIGARPQDYVVGVVGRLAEVKQPERAVALFELLADRHPRLQLVFVGDGDGFGALERRVRALSPPRRERVHLIGARATMAPVLRDLDAVLLCSRTEGLPVSLIEAGAAGLPVVAARVGGVEELVAHERTGFLGDDDTELAYGLDRLAANPEIGRQMGRRARLRVVKRHSAEALAEALERVYVSLAGAPA